MDYRAYMQKDISIVTEEIRKDNIKHSPAETKDTIADKADAGDDVKAAEILEKRLFERFQINVAKSSRMRPNRSKFMY